MDEREQLEHAIAAQEHVRATLGDAVVDATIAALKKQLAALEAERTSEQHKLVTVLFCDLVDFTPLAETLDPEEVRAVLDTYFQPWKAAITRYGGVVEKFIGDAVMAVFGIPTASEQDPENTICAALEVRDGLEALNTEIEQRSEIRLAMRVGINTGPVLVGAMGCEGDFTVTGDTVNLASRLEGKAPVNGILISHDTYRHVRGVFEVVPQEPITVKGKKELVQTYVVKRKNPRTFRLRTRGIEGIETRMIGRDAEFRHLQDASYTVFEDREMRMVTISGEAGIGKSRLLYEFENWAELQPERFYVFKGCASEQTHNLPYGLIRNLFAVRFQIAESDPLAVVHGKLDQGMAECMGVGHEEAVHFISHLLGYSVPDSPYLRGILDDPKQIRNIALHHLTQCFAAMTQEKPAVILLEDLHWADNGSLEVIQHLVQECRQLPILIVCCTRPPFFERRPLWGDPSTWLRTGGQDMHTRLDLSPLSKRDSRCLVSEILQHVANLPTKLRDLIVNRAEGNPFYVEELIKMLIEEGFILKAEDQWYVKAERLTDIKVPPTLIGVLQARLDKLPEAEHDLLKYASIIGRIFWDKAVESLMSSETHQTQETLHVLHSREIIFEREISAFEDTREYIFKHALLRDVTYERVLLRQRPELHAQAATWLIDKSGAQVDRYAGLIGEHFEKAQQVVHAVEWYGRAGKQAQNAYAPETAITYYQKALKLLDDEQTCQVLETWQVYQHRLALYEGLGEMFLARARYVDAIDAYTAMRSAAEAITDAPAQARAWYELAGVQEHQGKFRASLESIENAEAIARIEGASAQIELVKALSRKSWNLLRLGDFEKAIQSAEEALTGSITLNAKREMAFSLNALGSVNSILGRYDHATSHYEKALAIFRELGDRTGEETLLNNLSENARKRGDYQSALHGYREALTIVREIGNRDSEMWVLSNIGGTMVELEEYTKGEAELRQVIAMVGDASVDFLPETYSFLARACLGQGKVEEALATVQQAMTLAQKTEDPSFLGQAWSVFGQVATSVPSVRIGELDYTAAECFAESLRVFQEHGMEGEQARAVKAWAVYELTQGDRTKGDTLWQEARTIFERLGLSLLVEWMDAKRPY